VSEVSEAAVVRLLLADHVAADVAQKIYVIGGGITTLPSLPSGLTLPMALAVLVTVPPKLYNAEAAIEIVLEHENGTIVELGEPAQPMRIGQAVRFGEPSVAGFESGKIPARIQFVYSFNSGLPLESRSLYRWRVGIDHETSDDWTETFVVVTPSDGDVS
jgi:hypothetical protein